jgi:hypothetical protein
MLSNRELAREPEFVEVSTEILPHDCLMVALRRQEVSRRLQHLLRTEQMWEPLFATVTFILVGWYLFWLYHALQELMFVPSPMLFIF